MQKTVEAYSVFEGEKMGKIILIIEDDKGLNQGVALALRKPDWKFLQAFSLKEGLEYWETAEVDMVLLDINLPDGSGYDFLGHVRTASSVPVIMLTANELSKRRLFLRVRQAGVRSSGEPDRTEPYGAEASTHVYIASGTDIN